MIKPVAGPKIELTVSERFKKLGWAGLCLVAAIALLLYGIVFITNFLTQLNPLNTIIYYSSAVIAYGIVGTVFYFLWQRLGQLLTQAFSGISN